MEKSHIFSVFSNALIGRRNMRTKAAKVEKVFHQGVVFYCKGHQSWESVTLMLDYRCIKTSDFICATNAAKTISHLSLLLSLFLCSSSFAPKRFQEPGKPGLFSLWSWVWISGRWIPVCTCSWGGTWPVVLACGQRLLDQTSLLCRSKETHSYKPQSSFLRRCNGSYCLLAACFGCFNITYGEHKEKRLCRLLILFQSLMKCTKRFKNVWN